MTRIDHEAARTGTRRRRGRRTPHLLSILSMLLLVGIAGALTFPVLWRGRIVPMASVRAVLIVGPAATTVARAVGRVEADPFPTVVHPLVNGRIETIEVCEGAPVVAGETVIARLTSAPLQAAVERAEATCRERERRVDAASAAHDLAVARLAQNGDARLAASEARAVLAEKEVALAAARGAIERTRAEARSAAAGLAAQEQLFEAGSGNTVALERARAAAAAADVAVKTAEAVERSVSAARDVTAQRVALADELAADPVALKGAVSIAVAELERARADRDAGRTDLAISRRELDWATVLAPSSGIVLRLLSQPGADAGPGADGILSIYDPSRLRARIDVPLGSLGSIAADQDVELRSQVTGNTVVKGVVQRVLNEADPRKDTAQVTVRLVSPPPAWRPETPCSALFLATTKPDSARDANATAFVVPRAALQGDRVFVLEPGRSRARSVPVVRITDQGDDVVVRGDLSVTQRVALVAVTEDEPIRDESVAAPGWWPVR